MVTVGVESASGNGFSVSRESASGSGFSGSGESASGSGWYGYCCVPIGVHVSENMLVCRCVEMKSG